MGGAASWLHSSSVLLNPPWFQAFHLHWFELLIFGLDPPQCWHLLRWKRLQLCQMSSQQIKLLQLAVQVDALVFLRGLLPNENLWRHQLEKGQLNKLVLVHVLI